MKRLFAGVVICAAALGAGAQETTTSTAAAATPPRFPVVIVDSPSNPPLVTNVVVTAGDSELVRAAKMAVARRQQTSRVVTTETVKHATGARMSEPSQPLPEIPPAPTTSKPLLTPAQRIGPPRVDRAAVEKRLAELDQQQRTLAARAEEEAIFGTVEQDAVDRRIAKIRKEMEDLRRQLEAPQQP